MKANKGLFSGLIIVFALCFGVLYGGNHTTVNASMTKKQVKKKIVTLKKEIKKLQKKKVAEKKKEKKQAKGTKYIIGEIISLDPYIIHQDLIFSDSYYWIENDKYMKGYMGLGSGHVKITGKYRNYNGVTCRVCKAVKVGSKSYKYQKSINKKKKELKNCTNSLKEKVTLSNAKIKVNQKKKMKYKWKYSGKYNTIKWKSSNTKIASVDSKGNITGHKQGEVTITATCSISGNKSKCTVRIYDDFRVYAEIDGDNTEIRNFDSIEISEKQIQIICKFSTSSTKDEIIYECDSYNDIASITQDGLLTFKSPGYASIKISSSYKSIEFDVVEIDSTWDWDDDMPSGDDCLKIYNESDPSHNVINYGDTEYVNDKYFLFSYSYDIDKDLEDTTDLEVIYKCNNDVASVTVDSQEGIVTFRDNGTATISVYSSDNVFLGEFYVVCNSFDKTNTNEENKDDDYNDGDYNDGDYNDGDYDDGDYDDGDYDDGDYDDSDYDDEEYEN